jgi:hypothetical protein
VAGLLCRESEGAVAEVSVPPAAKQLPQCRGAGVRLAVSPPVWAGDNQLQVEETGLLGRSLLDTASMSWVRPGSHFLSTSFLKSVKKNVLETLS